MKILNIILISFCLFSGLNSFAQDTIITVEGEEIIATIELINNEEIHYYKVNVPDGPKYIMRINNVMMIKLSNGTRYVYPNNINQNSSNSDALPDYSKSKWYVVGSQHADEYHKGTEAFLISGALGLAFPIISLPVIIYYGLNKPKIRYENLPNPEYIKNEDFKEGYKNRARNKNFVNSFLGTLVGISPYIILAILFSQY